MTEEEVEVVADAIAKARGWSSLADLDARGEDKANFFRNDAHAAIAALDKHREGKWLDEYNEHMFSKNSPGGIAMLGSAEASAFPEREDSR